MSSEPPPSHPIQIPRREIGRLVMLVTSPERTGDKPVSLRGSASLANLAQEQRDRTIPPLPVPPTFIRVPSEPADRPPFGTTTKTPAAAHSPHDRILRGGKHRTSGLSRRRAGATLTCVILGVGLIHLVLCLASAHAAEPTLPAKIGIEFQRSPTIEQASTLIIRIEPLVPIKSGEVFLVLSEVRAHGFDDLSLILMRQVTPDLAGHIESLNRFPATEQSSTADEVQDNANSSAIVNAPRNSMRDPAQSTTASNGE